MATWGDVCVRSTWQDGVGRPYDSSPRRTGVGRRRSDTTWICTTKKEEQARTTMALAMEPGAGHDVSWAQLMDDDVAIELILKTDCEDVVPELETKPPRKLELEEVAPEFVHPIRVAASRLQVSSTSLKTFCRKHGISRWPFRRLQLIQRFVKKLENAIKDDMAHHGFEFVASIPEGRDILEQLESLYKERHFILHPPTKKRMAWC